MKYFIYLQSTHILILQVTREEEEKDQQQQQQQQQDEIIFKLVCISSKLVPKLG